MGLSSPEKRFSWATITDQKLPSGVVDSKCVKFWPKWPLFFWCCHSFMAWFLIPAHLAQGPAEQRERCWGSLNCPAFGVCLSALPSPWESSPAPRPSISQAASPPPPQPCLPGVGCGDSIAPLEVNLCYCRDIPFIEAPMHGILFSQGGSQVVHLPAGPMGSLCVGH